MSTVAAPHADQARGHRSESTFTHAIDRWIYVFMAVFFVAITLAGFIPDSLAKIAAAEAGQRPPFPLVLHLHSILMGSFLLLLLAQTVLAARGEIRHHQRLGLASIVLVPALVIVGFMLVPTIYHQFWNYLQTAPAQAQADIRGLLSFLDNIVLEQIRIGIAFPLFVSIALMARKTDAGLHKRMMFLAIAPALPAAFDRMTWLPTTLPESPLSPDLYILLAVTPMFIWDLVRTRKIHKAYVFWLAFMVPSSILIHSLWDTDWWHATARRMVGL
jgi:hypothetical protein